MEFQLSYFKFWKMMLWKCCTQYASKFGKLSSGHRAGKGPFSFQSQRKVMPKNAQTTTQLHSSHTLVWRKLHWRRKWQLTPVFLPGKSHGQKSLVGCSPWGRKELGTTGWLTHLTCINKVMLKILQARFQQYVNRELPDVQAGFRKGRGTRDQIANIQWIIKKGRKFQKNIYFCFID